MLRAICACTASTSSISDGGENDAAEVNCRRDTAAPLGRRKTVCHYLPVRFWSRASFESAIFLSIGTESSTPTDDNRDSRAVEMRRA